MKKFLLILLLTIIPAPFAYGQEARRRLITTGYNKIRVENNLIYLPYHKAQMKEFKWEHPERPKQHIQLRQFRFK